MSYDPINVYNIAENNIAFAIRNGKITVSADKIAVSLTEVTGCGAIVSFVNRSANTVDAVFVLAAYDSNGKMIGSSVVSHELASKETIPLKVASEDAKQIATLKGYALDPKTFIPIISVQEIEIITRM